MGFSNINEATCVMAYISEISPNYKLKLYVLFEEHHYKYLELPEQIQPWYIVRANSQFMPNYHKLCDSLRLFCTKISMNTALQQILLSTPLSNINCLNKLIRSSAIPFTAANNDIIKTIMSGLEQRMNPAQVEAVKSSLFSNLTLIQTP